MAADVTEGWEDTGIRVEGFDLQVRSGAEQEPVTDTPAPIQYAGGASERGRYAVFVTTDGGWKIVTRGPLCETCSSCGCGQDYRDPIDIPAFGVAWMQGGLDALPAPVRVMARQLAKVMGNG